MIGVVNLDKPVGPTSHDMVGLLRRLTGTRRIGHAGTLDPLASGTLPILVGAATRFSDELTGGRKRYDAVIRLGQRSVTDDAEGPILPSEAPVPDDETIRREVATFGGTFEQRPPAYSARKLDGRTAHRAARRGETMELPARPVTVDEIEVLGIERGVDVTDVRVDLRCGPGTYVRSIARDLGELLGCGGHVHALRRTMAAGLLVADGWTPDALERLAGEGRLVDALLPVAPLIGLPQVQLDEADAWRFEHGSTVWSQGTSAIGRVKVLDPAGRLLGIGEADAEMLRPAKVLPAEARA